MRVIIIIQDNTKYKNGRLGTFCYMLFENIHFGYLLELFCLLRSFHNLMSEYVDTLIRTITAYSLSASLLNSSPQLNMKLLLIRIIKMHTSKIFRES